MTDYNRNHLKAWREFRRMTQEELAESVGTSKSVISDLENAKRALSPKWLRRLAPVLKTNAGHILDHDPNDLDNDILDIWSDIPDRNKEQALKTLGTFTDKKMAAEDRIPFKHKA